MIVLECHMRVVGGGRRVGGGVRVGAVLAIDRVDVVGVLIMGDVATGCLLMRLVVVVWLVRTAR